LPAGAMSVHTDRSLATFADVSYRYTAASALAVESVSLDVRAREFLAIVGPSGCGKSTLLRMLIGLSSPTAGTLSFSDEIDQKTGEAASIVFQDPTLLPWRTALANVALPLELRGVDRATRHERAREALTDAQQEVG